MSGAKELSSLSPMVETDAPRGLGGQHRHGAEGAIASPLPAAMMARKLKNRRRRAAAGELPAAGVTTAVDGDRVTTTLTAVVQDRAAASDADGGGAAGARPEDPETGQETGPEAASGGEAEAVHIDQLPGEPEVVSGCDHDAIASTLGYAGNVTHGGVALGAEFGLTSSRLNRFRTVTITPAGGTFTVTARLVYEINWDTCHGVGPDGQVDIPDPAAAAIHAGNYTQVADDLTPDMSDLDGRPPRRNFWAQDLTERHERFHAEERRAFGQQGTTAAQAWLNRQTAGSTGEVTALLDIAWQNQIRAFINTSMANPGKEQRAYGDGAPAYRARADAVRARGAGGHYPAAPGSTPAPGGGTPAPTPAPGSGTPTPGAVATPAPDGGTLAPGGGGTP